MTHFPYPFAAIVTVLVIFVYLWTAVLVGKARKAHGVNYPETTGPEAFTRVWRAHMNTLEQLPVIYAAMWLFATIVSDRWAALGGLIWCVGRILYVRGYAIAPEKRSLGFLIGALASLAMLLGSLGVVVWQLLG